MNLLKRFIKQPYVWLCFSFFVALVDQASKIWVTQAYLPGESHPVLSCLNVTLRYNRGAAFSFLGSASGWQAYLLIAISLAAVVFLLLWLGRLSAGDQWLSFSIALVLGGAVGNMIDRVRLRYVIDFIDFHIKGWHYATFNVADAAVCVGVVLLVLPSFFRRPS